MRTTPQENRRCAAKLKVLANRTRLHVLRELLGGPRTVGELNTTLRVQQSLLSHHLQALRRAGFVTARRSGKRVLYRLANNVAADPAASELNLGCCRLSFD